MKFYITHGQSSDPTSEDSSARHWLLEHGHREDDLTFESDVASLVRLIRGFFDQGTVPDEQQYDDMYGDNKECLCGHPYYRHFDPFENMAPVGCKYCCHWSDFAEEQHGAEVCTGFKEKPIVQPVQQSQSTADYQNDDYCRMKVGCTCPDCLAPGYGGHKP